MKRIADIEYLDAVTGKIKKVGDLMQENSDLKFKLKQIEDFMTYEFSGKNEWVKQNVLKIIKDNKNFLKKTSKMLDDALDSDKTDAEQSFDLLYLISERLKKKIEELEGE